MKMNRLLIVVFTACALLTACGRGNDTGTAATGGAGSITIISPEDGAKVSANRPLELQYKVDKSPQGDHVHISVDNGKPDVVRQLEGKYELPPLSPGEHRITIMEVTSSHSPTGNQAVIHVQAE